MGDSTGRRAAALARFEQVTELPLLILALAMIPVIIAPLVFDLSPAWSTAFDVADIVILVAFIFEYAVRLTLTTERLKFMRREWADLVIIAVPFFRPLRILRSARALRLLRLTRLVALGAEASKESRRLVLRHKLHYVIFVAVLFVLGAAALVLEFERDDGNIRNFGNALWWSLGTATNAGAGPEYPVTPQGRIVAAVLMIGGVALFGVITANIAAWMIDGQRASDESPEQDRLDEILARLDAIEQRLAAKDS